MDDPTISNSQAVVSQSSGAADPAQSNSGVTVVQMFDAAPPAESGLQGVVDFRPQMPWTWDTTKITWDMTWPRWDATKRVADGWF